MEQFPRAPDTFYTYDREALGEGAQYADTPPADTGLHTCQTCGREYDTPFRVGNAMTPDAPPDRADGASRAYCSMACFMQGDGALEQASVDRDASGWWALARRNWFGLKVLCDDRKRGA